MISPFLDNFADLSNWTVSGVAVNAGQVSASAGGTFGTAYRPLGAAGDVFRLAFDIVVNKSDAGRYIGVAVLDAAGNKGVWAGYFSGYGLLVDLWLQSQGGPYDIGSGDRFLLADALIPASPTRYHLELVCFSGQTQITARVYDALGKPVTHIDASNQPSANGYTYDTADFFSCARLQVGGNSALCAISNLAIDSNLLGTAVTAANFTNTAYGRYLVGGSGAQSCSLYLPGAAANSARPTLCIYTHGTDASSMWDWTQLSLGTHDINAALAAGCTVLVPSEYTSFSTNCWANADGWNNDILPAIQQGLSIVGPDADVLLIGYSMGGLVALGRIIGGGAIANIRAARLVRPVCDLAWAEQSLSFAADIDAAWQITSHPASYAAAKALVAAADPMQLIAAHPARFAGIAYYIDTGGRDTYVPPANNALPFTAALLAAGIAFTLVNHGQSAHTDPTFAADAQAWMRQSVAAVAGTIPIAKNAAQTSAWLTTRDGQGIALAGVMVTFELLDPVASTDSYNQSPFTATSDATGLLQVLLLRNAQYQARVGSGPWITFTTGTSGVFPLPEVLGSY